MLARIERLGATVLVWVFLGVATLLASILSDGLAVSASSAVTGVVFFGYPYLVCRHLLPLFHARRRGPPNWLYFAVALCAQIAAGPLSQAQVDDMLVLPIVFVGLLCPLVLMWTAARCLVELEEGRSTRAIHAVGTFVLFLFLPFGVWFLQGRVLALVGVAPRPA